MRNTSETDYDVSAQTGILNRPHLLEKIIVCIGHLYYIVSFTSVT